MSRNDIPVLAVIAIGGGIGAVSRYGIAHWMPPVPRQIPWSTLLINATGCFLIGVLMVLITEVWAAHRLLRPFLGVGILGGFTTFSTYAVESRGLLEDGEAALALAYIFGTALVAIVAVVLGVAATRTISGVVPRGGANA